MGRGAISAAAMIPFDFALYLGLRLIARSVMDSRLVSVRLLIY